jgi:hypothetical protein
VSPMTLKQNDKHRQASAAAIRGQKGMVAMKCDLPVLRDVRLAKDGPGGAWQVYIGKGKPLPASPVEVALWLELRKAKGGHGQEAVV